MINEIHDFVMFLFVVLSNSSGSTTRGDEARVTYLTCGRGVDGRGVNLFRVTTQF